MSNCDCGECGEGDIDELTFQESECCGITFVSDAHDGMTKEGILGALRYYIEGHCYGPQRMTFLVVTTPTEKKLAQTLASAGFSNILRFPRSRASGLLTLWSITLKKRS